MNKNQCYCRSKCVTIEEEERKKKRKKKEKEEKKNVEGQMRVRMKELWSGWM
jgi:hypothetical protein